MGICHLSGSMHFLPRRQANPLLHKHLFRKLSCSIFASTSWAYGRKPWLCFLGLGGWAKGECLSSGRLRIRRLSVPVLMGCEVGSDSQSRDGNGAHSSFTERTRLVAAHLQVPPVNSGTLWAPPEPALRRIVSVNWPLAQLYSSSLRHMRPCECATAGPDYRSLSWRRLPLASDNAQGPRVETHDSFTCLCTRLYAQPTWCRKVREWQRTQSA